MELSNMKALKLDSTYRPIEVIDALDALVMCLVGKAMSIETHQRKGARTPSEAHMYPISTPIKPKNSILRTLVPTQISDIWKEYLWE